MGFTQAQTTPAWFQYSGPADYANYDVREVCVGTDTSGNVYTAGSIYDTIHNMTKTLLVKYNSAGVQQWLQTFDNTNQTSNDKRVVALLVDKIGNSYLCGYAYTHGGTTSKDYFIEKYDNTGSQIWNKTYDGGESAWDYITCATFDAAGNIIVGGYANNNGGSQLDDIAIVKYGTSGTQIWVYQYSSPGEDRCFAIASDASSNIYVTGSTYVTNGRNMITIKLNSSGVSQWSKIIPHVNSSNDERGYSIAADASGNCYVSGNAGDWLTMKYDPYGTVLWTNHHSTNSLNADSYQRVMLDQNGDVIIVSDSYNSGSDLSVSKLANATGTSLWSVTKNFGGTDRFSDAVLDNQGNVYIGGYYDGPLGKDVSAMIVSNGGIDLRDYTFSNSARAAGTDLAYHVAVDKYHNFYLAGLAERRGSGSSEAVDILTLKYSALITGIKENSLKNSQWSMYPNPAKDNLTLSFTEQTLIGSQLSLTNMLGEVVKKDVLVSLSQTLDIRDLSKGMYMVNISTAGGIASGKIIIE